MPEADGVELFDHHAVLLAMPWTAPADCPPLDYSTTEENGKIVGSGSFSCRKIPHMCCRSPPTLLMEVLRRLRSRTISTPRGSRFGRFTIEGVGEVDGGSHGGKVMLLWQTVRDERVASSALGIEVLIEGDAAVELFFAVHLGGELGEPSAAGIDTDRSGFSLSRRA